MRAYYNENDPFAANWLRNLIDAGLITPGDVDDRSIHDVQGTDLKGYERCHFFAGIAGWELALQYAGWRGPVWTGSCPCQPFSSAGKGKGTNDERHLWPEFYRLIRECKPPTVLGEQVASKAGRGWLDGVFADLEGMGYAAAGADLCAACINAPHIRQRLFWVSDAERLRAWTGDAGEQSEQTQDRRRGLADSGDGLGNAPSQRCTRFGGSWQEGTAQPGEVWSDFDVVRCVEPTKEPGRYVEKWRRVEPGLVPLAHGIPGRVGRLRGYGNAIVPQVAAEFITAYMQSNQETKP